ncbi:MAG TPA: potassium channel family protein [Chitinophaga sp.]|uniref:potassium channel family protein n=1 Tax=Chitinophaga sp. TaxID=1869181 RepID=UPI002C5CB9AB|nr:potassium channel family protein [Chitinophaga sp.]HVI47954.1 potassium channel family protein [Chitinophaga sp.]
MKHIIAFLRKQKYEVLLAALLQHLFIGIFLSDLPFYTHVIWPVNMIILGLASVSVFVGKSRWKSITRYVLFIAVVALPLCLPLIRNIRGFMPYLCTAYVIFYIFIFWEIMRFLVKPGYINTDIISAAACGYLLLIEISVFLLQSLLYRDPTVFKGVDISGPAATYMDLVYFCSITITSIGFGDIVPNTACTKLITSLFGIAGQFYTVVLVGILISKFSSRTSS